jgi:large subunit ribosomal protein L21
MEFTMTEQRRYAIIKTGGKQYRVAENDVIDVELLDKDDGTQVEFADVLFVNDATGIHVGKPIVSGYLVRGTILGTVQGEKITSVKYKRSHNQYRKFGHRQRYSRVQITGIGA